MKIINIDVLVIGGGLAGQRAAIAAKRRGQDVLVLSMVPPKRSHSAAAQGGMQASLANVVKGLGDNEDVHFADTVRGSDWGADQDVVRMFVHTAPKAVREMAAWGVPWSRVQAGDREAIINGERVTLTEREAAHGLIAQRDFGGTRKWRTCHVSDGTGHALLYSVSDRVIAESIPVHERREALRLIHADGRCHGAIVRNLITGELCAYVARATLIATGGSGRLYRVTTNAVINEGMGHALALDSGVACLGNMEAVQFHPTGIFPAGILVTEGCRGDGGLLRDGEGHRFMPDYEPEKKELASRDVVSRRMEQHILAGHGAQSRFGEHLWLDITLLGRTHIDKNLREVKEICQYFLGIDPVKEWIPVRPAQHYTMGGVRTDAQGAAVGMAGLFAAGESACWDLHGFNRLGGNSVAETVVAGMLVGETIADWCEQEPEDGSALALARQALADQQAELSTFMHSNGQESAFALRTAMQEVMTRDVGIFRNGDSLQRAVDELASLIKRSDNIGVRQAAAGANPELMTAYRTRRMLRLAQSIAYGALQRTESRGAHYRDDYPRRDDANWLKRTLARWPDDEATTPELTYEALDVGTMELPPGWRGYGEKNHVEHPGTANRETEVSQLKQRLNGEELQQALLPFRDKLPPRYRGNNQRLPEDSL